jgi:hypothetical protein
MLPVMSSSVCCCTCSWIWLVTEAEHRHAADHQRHGDHQQIKNQQAATGAGEKRGRRDGMLGSPEM